VELPFPFERLSATRDATLVARIVGRTQMRYAGGADAALDRPAHVRAASGMQWFGGVLAVIQDDTGFLALVDPVSGLAEGIPLPAGPDGRRVFDTSRGTKELKLDLEACVMADVAGAPHLIALGSGSSARRERIVLVPFSASKEAMLRGVREVDAAAFYAALRACPEFSGSELNLEGAALRGASGEARAGRLPIDAVCTVSWLEFARYLDGPAQTLTPKIEGVTQYDLGEVDGIRLTFTDATCTSDGSVIFLACAEASPNAVDDGEVRGTAIGIIEGSGAARLTLLLDENGQPCRDKIEGIALDPRDPQRLLLSVDRDDPSVPSELLEVRLSA
jgi:hypothetical protein